jgi:hypothetical protein
MTKMKKRSISSSNFAIKQVRKSRPYQTSNDEMLGYALEESSIRRETEAKKVRMECSRFISSVNRKLEQYGY